ncbi:MAG: hypothetical protein RR190_05805, partial [Bacteroidales bacterium]
MHVHKNFILICFFSFFGINLLLASPITYLIKGTIRNVPPNSYAKLLRWNGYRYAVDDSCLITKTSFTI